VHVFIIVCVCAHVCGKVIVCVRVSQCVVCVCVRVCVVKSWRSGLRSMYVCVCGNGEPCRLESTPGRKRERTPTRGHRRLTPPPPRPVFRLLSAIRNSNFYPVNTFKEITTLMEGGVGDKTTIRIVLIQNATHFSEVGVFDV